MKFALYSSYKETCRREPGPIAPRTKIPLAPSFVLIYLSGCPNRLPADVILVADDKNRRTDQKGDFT
jgi:hypothetical protein